MTPNPSLNLTPIVSITSDCATLPFALRNNTLLNSYTNRQKELHNIFDSKIKDEEKIHTCCNITIAKGPDYPRLFCFRRGLF